MTENNIDHKWNLVD